MRTTSSSDGACAERHVIIDGTDMSESEVAALVERDRQFFSTLGSIYEQVYELDYTDNIARELYAVEDTVEISHCNKLSLSDGYEAIINELVHPDDIDIYRDLYSPEGMLRHFGDSDLASASVEIRMRNADGSYHWENCALIRMVDIKDKYVFLSCAKDITEVKRAQASIKELEGQQLEFRSMQRIIERIPVGIGVYDLEDGFKQEYVNQRVLDIFGLGPDESSELDWLANHLDEHYHDFLEKLIESSRVRPGEVETVTLPSFKVDGTPFLNQISATVVDELDGTSLGYFVMSDVTEQVEREKEFSRQQEIYEMILRSTSDILFEYDVIADSLHIFNSENLSKGIYSRIPDFRNYLKARFAKRDPAEIGEFLHAVTRASSDPGENEYVFRSNIVGDELRWFRATCRSLPDAKTGKVERVIGLIREISEEQKLKAELLSESQQREKYQQRAAVDQLTGVLSRWALKEQIADVMRAFPESGAFVMFDLDNFKLVNDTYGHQMGDQLLKAMGVRLKATFRCSDIIGRLGGDEFVLYLNGIKDREAAAMQVARVVECVTALREEYDIDVDLGVSAGVALLPVDGANFRDLYSTADRALYQAKNKGKNHFQFASEPGEEDGMSVNSIDRALLARMFSGAANELLAGAEKLSDIDSRFGDGDHGVTITKIAKAIQNGLASWEEASLHDFVVELGEDIMAVGGGSAGPLYGTMVGSMGDAFDSSCTEIDPATFKALYAAMGEGLGALTPAKPGDKTMMDALIPAVEAAQGAPDDIRAIASAAAQAAREGARRSEEFPAKFGRARMYGDQTIGTPDAGALSTAMFIKGFAVPLGG